MGTDFANPDGTASMRLIRYYEERAKGGVGLIINEYTGVDESTSIPSNYNLRLSRDWHIASAEQLVEAVHRHDCLIFAQLHHAGSTSKPALTGRQPISASDVPPVPGGLVPQPMSPEEIKDIQQKFVNAAMRAKKAGYDGVELHGAHSYLIGQFFSPYYNKRTDSYGGCLENRMRFIDEIIDGVRETLGSDFPISVRICGDEMTPDVPGSLTLEDGLAIGLHLEKKGIDVLNVSNGSALNANANCDPYSYTPGWKKYVAKAFKEALSIPVIATNTIKNPAFAEQLLEEGVCDFVGLGRSQFADPFFMKKAKTRKEEQIRPCIGCMVCRERLLMHQSSVACAVNPRMGREYIENDVKKDGGNRPVAVIGGGPAGMEAAIVLAQRGYKPTLFEKESALGGTLNLADKPPHKKLISELVKSMSAQLAALDVDVRLNTEASPETVAEISPVGVFVACGAEPILPSIPGIKSAHVHTAEDVLRKEAKLRGRIAVIGTGMTGLETAELLLESGYEVVMAEMRETVGPGLFAVILNDSMRRIKAYSPTILTGHKLTAIGESEITLETSSGEHISVQADSVVLALGVAPKAEIVEAYKTVSVNVFAAGDTRAAGRIYEAMRDAHGMAAVFCDI
jgi:2,4-dienoyl-CoA reductase-like NADH-dependent reductase (Old Yellow Enzyme family)/thioredoxin reductase